MASNGELFEIFSWLPAKSIFKLACVAKSCNEFSSEDHFINKQSQNMVYKNDSSFFVQPYSYRNYEEGPEFYVLPGENSSTGVPSKSLDFLREFSNLLGSSNGLVCCTNASEKEKPMDDELFICNPSTAKWSSIPHPWKFQNPDREFKVLFQCSMGQSDSFSYDYFLMAVRGTDYWSSDFHCRIYSQPERTWQDEGLVNFGDRKIIFEAPVYKNGVFYFMSDWYPSLPKESSFYWPYIVEFDPKTKVSSFLRIPKGARKHDYLDTINLNMGIFKWGHGDGGSICFVTLSKGVFDVWVMGSKESGLGWKRILKVRVRAMRMVESEPQIGGFTVINGDSLLVATKNRVYRYNLTGHWRWKRAKKVCVNRCGPGSVWFYPYSNTLRPCGDSSNPIS